MIRVTDIHMPELKIYGERSEVQLLHYYEPEPGIFIAESLRVMGRALDAGYEPLSLLIEERHLREENDRILKACENVPIYLAETEQMSELAGYKLTGGALCAMRRKKLSSVEAVCEKASRLAVLEGINNPTNVGAIFRSAAALGVDAVLLTKDCSDPFYRRAARVSMGTVFQIPWTYMKGELTETDRLRELGYVTVAMALNGNTVAMNAPCLKGHEKMAVILGNENDGLSPQTVEKCDYVACIPMLRGVDSLNVAAASAVAFWELYGRSDGN